MQLISPCLSLCLPLSPFIVYCVCSICILCASERGGRSALLITWTVVLSAGRLGTLLTVLHAWLTVIFSRTLPSSSSDDVVKARGYAYAKIEYVSVRSTHVSFKYRIRTLRILEPWMSSQFCRSGSKQSGSGQPDSLPCSTNHCKHALCFITQCQESVKSLNK